MVGFSSRLEILAEMKCKSENKGLIQASWLSPYLCRRSLPVACLKPRNQVWAPPWPSCQHWAGVRSQQENLLLRPDWGGLLAASRPGSKTSVGSRVCVIRAQLGICSSPVSWEDDSFLDFWKWALVLEMGLETEIASFSGWDILHGEGHGKSE